MFRHYAPRLLRSTATVVLRILVAAALVFLAFVGLGPRTGRYAVLTVLTGSMRPTAAPGSLAVVTPVPIRTLRVGDVITYRIPVDDHRVVTHRIVEIRDEGTGQPTVRTKGDANDSADPWTATLQGDVAWELRFDLPRFGTLVRALRSPVVHDLTVGLVPLALAAVWLVQIWGHSAAGGDHGTVGT